MSVRTFAPVSVPARLGTRAADDGTLPELRLREISMVSDTMQIDEETGELEFDLIILTEREVDMEAYVPGQGWHRFREIIDVKSLDLARCKKGLPLLMNHNRWTAEARIGIITKIKRSTLDDGTPCLIGRGRVAGDDDAATIRSRIARGISPDFSAGYFVPQYREENEGDDGVLRAMGTLVYECSNVPVPADYECQVRALVPVYEGEDQMTVRAKGAQGGKPQKPAKGQQRSAGGAPEGAPENEPENDPADLEDELQANDDLQEDDDDGNDGGEGQRSLTGNDLALQRRARTLGADDAFLGRYLGTATTPAQMTRQFHAQLADATGSQRDIGMPASPIRGAGNREIQGDLAVRALVAAETGKITDVQTDQFRGILNANGGFNARDLMTLAMQRNGYQRPQDLDMSPEQFMQIRAVAPMVIADFMHLANKGLAQLVKLQAQQLPYWGDGITRRTEFTDFLGGQFLGAIVLDALLETPAGSEVKAGGMSLFDTDGKPVTYNRRYPISRQLWSGNGTGLFNDLAIALANAGINAENTALRNKILTNPVMSDKVPFFHGSRLNVATGVSMDKEGFGLVQATAMRPGGPGVNYGVIIANPIHTTLLDTLTARGNTGGGDNPANYNPFAGKFQPVYIYGFPKDAMMFITDPRVLPAFLRMVRSGQETTQQKIVETAQFDGFELLAYLDRGIAHGDPRAAFLAFTGDEPAQLPNGDEANYESSDIGDVIE